MPSAIAAMTPAEASRRLSQSRRLWNEWRQRPPDYNERGHVEPGEKRYSYVRTWRRSDERVDFTLLVVDGERVTLRALVSAHPERIDSISLDPPERSVRSVWIERGVEVGRHDDGAPARSVEALYDECARLISEHPELAPRLHFHPNGVLMNCGFRRGECSDCGEVGIQSFSRYPLGDELAQNDSASWVCGTRWGLFPPTSELPMQTLYCYPAERRPKREPRLTTAGEHEVQDICKIDPAACRKICVTNRDCDAARWAIPLAACPGWPARAPKPLELGKRDPLAEWVFPFNAGAGIECEGSPRTVYRRIRPELR